MFPGKLFFHFTYPLRIEVVQAILPDETCFSLKGSLHAHLQIHSIQSLHVLDLKGIFSGDEGNPHPWAALEDLFVARVNFQLDPYNRSC